MKKTVSAIAMIFAVLFLFCGCGKTPPAEMTSVDGSPVYPASTPPDPFCEVHTFDIEDIIVEPGVKTEGMTKLTCSVCGIHLIKMIPATDSVKILAIGNSFSADAMEYLYDICDAAGIGDIVLGNLYIGGCSLDTHWDNIQKNANAYTYYENVYGYWTTKNAKSILAALEAEDWDIITVQQASGDSGMSETYGNLQNILDYIHEHKADAKIYWHMTWAYQSDSSHGDFANYEKNQLTMYHAIVDTVNDTVFKHERIAGVIPSGTAIQNLRTSYIGDTLTRDGYHLSYDAGRYTAALTWFAALTGLPVEDIDWMPESCAGIRSDKLEAIREAVNAALKTPLSVTESSLPATAIPVKTLEITDADRETLQKLGYDPERFEVLDWEPTVAAYYNSTASAALVSRANSTASNLPYFTASRIFTKEELPDGTVIAVDDGYQYRPEGWTSLSSKNTSAARPANVTGDAVVVSDKWWGNFRYRAFNLSHSGSTTDMTEADSVHLRIYIPKEEG